VARSANLPSLLAASLALVVGCKAAKTEVAVSVKVTKENEAYRPEYAELDWHGPPGHDFRQRLPATGTLTPLGDLLTTVLIGLDDATPGERIVVVKGLKNGAVISGDGQRVAFTPGQRVEVILFMKPWVDTNGNELPDALDCPPSGACTMSDAGVDDGGGDGAAGDGGSDVTDAGADADATPG
jgi:hypothetical protein